MNGISNINDMWNESSLQLNSFQFVPKKKEKEKGKEKENMWNEHNQKWKHLTKDTPTIKEIWPLMQYLWIGVFEETPPPDTDAIQIII